jgi:hypothetical protein
VRQSHVGFSGNDHRIFKSYTRQRHRCGIIDYNTLGYLVSFYCKTLIVWMLTSGSARNV